MRGRGPTHRVRPSPHHRWPRERIERTRAGDREPVASGCERRALRCPGPRPVRERSATASSMTPAGVDPRSECVGAPRRAGGARVGRRGRAKGWARGPRSSCCRGRFLVVSTPVGANRCRAGSWRWRRRTREKNCASRSGRGTPGSQAGCAGPDPRGRTTCCGRMRTSRRTALRRGLDRRQRRPSSMLRVVEGLRPPTEGHDNSQGPRRHGRGSRR